MTVLTARRIRLYWLPWVVLPLGFAVAAYAVTEYRRTARPVAVAPQEVDLGIQDNTAVITTDIIYQNDGREALELSHFSVSCSSCFSLAVRSAGGEGNLKSVRVEPRQHAVLVAQISLTGGPDQPFRGFIDCRTNDPDVPELRVWIRAEIRGRLLALPGELNFPNLKRSLPASRTIALVDSSHDSSTAVSRVEVVDCSFVSAVYSADIDSAATASSLAGRRLGSVKVTVNSDARVGPFSGRILVYANGEDKVRATIPFAGELAPMAKFLPARIVFLTDGGGGAKRHSATLVCSGPIGEILKVTPTSIPAGVNVHRLHEESSDSEHRFRVEWTGTRQESEQVRDTLVLTFRVESSGRSEQINVPIRFLEANP